MTRAVRRSSYRLDLGGVMLGAEALRLQGRPGGWRATSAIGRPRKSWATGLTSEWAIGAHDRLSFGLAGGNFRTTPPADMTADPGTTTSVTRLDVTWARGGRWRLGMGWQQDGGATRNASDRIVAIANGAPLHEQGFHLSVGFVPGGSDDPNQTSFGFEARRASVSAADLAAIGSGLRQDVQETMYFRRHF